jgi:ABC-type antimicrobial peptide transport system permease subunit
MMATGFSRSDLSGLLVLENLGLVVAGLLCGAVSALVSVAPQLASVESKVNWGSIIFMLAGILIIGLCSCAIAARVAVKNDLIDALREE